MIASITMLSLANHVLIVVITMKICLSQWMKMRSRRVITLFSSLRKIFNVACVSIGVLFALSFVPAEAAVIKLIPNGSGGYDYRIVDQFSNSPSTGTTGSNRVQITIPRTPITPAPAPTPSPSPAPTPTPVPAPTAGLTSAEQTLVNLINRDRSASGLPALQVDMQLAQLARMKSQDMITNNYFSHTSPTYGTPFQMLTKAGVKYRAAGENIAGNRSVESAHVSLMNSPGHRANILNSSYTHVGIGVVAGGPYGMMITEIFIGR
jgi:uncharacterized YkwD family protein